MTALEPYPSCSICLALPVPHDRMRYGDGRALRSFAVLLLREIGASDEQVEVILRGLGGRTWAA